MQHVRRRQGVAHDAESLETVLWSLEVALSVSASSGFAIFKAVRERAIQHGCRRYAACIFCKSLGERRLTGCFLSGLHLEFDSSCIGRVWN